nr:MAG TPA: hypothetical protein [Caudoviricetes sp.]
MRFNLEPIGANQAHPWTNSWTNNPAPSVSDRKKGCPRFPKNTLIYLRLCCFSLPSVANRKTRSFTPTRWL